MTRFAGGSVKKQLILCENKGVKGAALANAAPFTQSDRLANPTGWVV